MQSFLSAELSQKCANVRLVVSDVDGTLTDGGMYYGQEGEVMKRFSAHDGMGLRLLMDFGIQVALLTSEKSLFAKARADKLGIQHVLTGAIHKDDVLHEFTQQLNISLQETLYIGDDINDVAAMQLCGIVACPANAVACVRSIAHIVSTKDGGNGAVREIADILFAAKGISLESLIKII